MNHSTHSPYRRAALMAALTAVVTVIALPAAAHDFKAGDVVIDHPYTVPSVPGSANGAVYFRALRNDGLWTYAWVGTYFYIACSPQLWWAALRIRDGAWGTRPSLVGSTAARAQEEAA